MSADRNLLFGILALQMDFIGNDQLVQAMKDWADDKPKSIGEVLVNNGALSGDDRTLLEPIVDRHIQKHGNSLEQSLSAVSISDELKAKLDASTASDIADSLRDEATQIIGYAPPVPPPVTLGTPTSEGSRFEIIRPHARGGLGLVSVAMDSELNREVALKEILEQHSNDFTNRSRFNLEALITGGLEHPGIVPVYGLGHYDDGRPFYAMRFIRGESLGDAVERYHESDATADSSDRSLAMRDLLGRFVDVCNAIQYAHSKGVLHRDLKPSNIMLGRYGETLVVDWGLAKVRDGLESPEGELPLDPDLPGGSIPTMVGSAIGTPSYMSPEQAKGNPDEQGPVSDVYSLGATLYTVLTGRRAFSGDDVRVILKHVRTGDFPRPRDVMKEIARPLEAICLKAMATDRADRYETPADLAADIVRFLADEPVAAYVEPWSMRARRWTRKHQTLASTTGAAVLLSAVGLATLFGIVSAKNAELAEKNLALSNKEQELRIESEGSNQVSQFLLGLFEDTDPIAFGGRSFGPSTGMGKELTAQHVIDRGAEKLGTMLVEQPAVRAQLLDQIGNVYLSFGVPDRAKPLLEEGFELRTKLFDPDHKGIANEEIANSLESLGFMRLVQGKDGSKEFERSIALRSELFGEDCKQVADVKFKLALQITTQGKFKEAEPIATEALELLKTHYHEQSKEYAWGQFCLGYVKLQLSKPAGAKLITVATKTIDSLEGNTDFGDFIGAYMMARVQAMGPFRGVARKKYEEAIERGETLFSRQHGMVVHVRSAYADFLSDNQEHEDAEEVFKLVVSQIREVYGQTARQLMNPLLQLARNYRSMDRIDDAIQTTRESLAVAVQYDDEEHQISALHVLAMLVAKSDLDEGENLVREGIGLARSLFGVDAPKTNQMYESLTYILLRRNGVQHANLPNIKSSSPQMTFDQACLQSRAAHLIDANTSESSGETKEHQSKMADRAIQLLKDAVGGGFTDFNAVRSNPDLAPLRSRQDFKKWIVSVEQDK